MTESLEPVAVIGAACRFPAAADLDALWNLLRHEREAATTPSDEDLLAAGSTPDDLADPDYVRAVLLTPGVDHFDAGFFGMSESEADACDPQLRMFLEAAHSAVEDSGRDLTVLRDGVGVFAAALPGRYRDIHLLADPASAAEQTRLEPDLAAFISGRLDLRGPPVTVGSGSLLAVHLAVRSLAAGDCDIALAGGAHLELPYGQGYRWVAGGRRPPDGHSRPFDAAASGCLVGSGTGVVVLKRLDDAIADGDFIRAVIRSSAVGHPGTDDTGWCRAIAEALGYAGCDPADLSYVEADGSASGRADACEVAALARAFRLTGGAVPPAGEIPLGSVKSNLGDLGSAAGVAGLLKTVLALHQEHLPATLNVTAPHPGLGLEATPFRIAHQSSPWPAMDGAPRLAAVHGVTPGGGNALLVVEQAPRPHVVEADTRPRIVVWSARHSDATDAAASVLAGYFSELPRHRFLDAVATLQRGRTAHPVRRAVVCADAVEAAQAVTGSDVISAGRPVSRPPAVVFSFPGLGTARRIPIALYGTEVAFTEAADLCLDALERHGMDLYHDWTAGQVADSAGLLFTVEYALAALWQSWGVHPSAVIGTGVGELAAAVTAGALDLDAAVRVLTGRDSEATLSDPAVPAWSAAHGRPLTGPVTFHLDGSSGGLSQALEHVFSGVDRPVLLEVGPGDELTRQVKATTRLDVALVAPLSGTGDAERSVLAALGQLWVSGVAVDWERVSPDHSWQPLPVPGYPYQRNRHWVVPQRGPAAPKQATGQSISGQPVNPRPVTAVAAAVDGMPEPALPLRPLGHTEHAFWVLEQLAPESGVSNIGIAFRTARPLRWWPLQTAVNHLLHRHPALRLRFPEVGGSPVRHLTEVGDAKIQVQTRTTTPENLVGDLREFLHRPFDLGRDFLFRVGHFTLPGGTSAICLAAHHIVIDAPSVQILVEELGQIYDGITSGGGVPEELATEAPLLAEPEPSLEAVRYWLDHLRGADPQAMVLPGSRPTPARPTFAGHTCSWRMTDPARRAMRDLRRELKTTDNVVLLSAFCLTLLRHGAGPDLVIGVPVGTRRPATAKQVGYGVSTMPLRVRVDPRSGFRELVNQVGTVFFAGVEHADATVERVITERGHGTGDWRVPLFRHMFNYRPWSDENIRICGEVPDYIEDLFDRSRIDLQCIAVPEPDRLTLRCWHSTEVHDEADVEAFVARMQALLERAAAAPDRPVGELSFGSNADEMLWRRTNQTAREWGAPHTVPERIAERAHTAPDAVAVVDGASALTYQSLVGRAVAVRDLLREQGVRPGQVTALALERSADLVAAVIGVWAAGGCYLPLDPRQPATRLRYQVQDAGARLILTHASLPWTALPALSVPGTVRPGPLFDTGPPDPDSPAYLIYTSGSTGLPKGVVVSHRNLLNLVCDFTERLGAETARSALWSTTMTFDISALELLLPLVNGGRVVVAPDEVLLKPRDLLDLVRDRDVSLVQATPTAWRLILPEASGELAGRTLLCGGESMPATLSRELRRHGARVINVYGPTETTIWSTAADLEADLADPVPIGSPIGNTQVFITDPSGRELPPGVPGELCIAGCGVSSGYLNRPELTADRFREHPRYGRFYRTGDIARLRHDGVLELSGRNDRQVKLRGHRIELDEVEAVLHQHPDVALVAVTLHGDPQADGRLVGHVQPQAADADPHLLREALWRHARERLPDYAVPSGIAVLNRLPTTPNGKLDYRSLADVEPDRQPRGSVETTFADPELTEALTELWREALRRPGLGPDDNFFLNGGHSILAARLASRIEQATGQPVAVRLVFDHPTPAELAGHLTERDSDP